MKIIYKSESQDSLPSLLEGYLFGLGEVCHTLFGADGEKAMYEAIGSHYLEYLAKKENIAFTEDDPWERYCHIIRVFTERGFYSHAELEDRGEGTYWMLEVGQYAGAIWEEQGSFERGSPPCPLWATLLRSLGQIGHVLVIDTMSCRPDMKGLETTFHFDPTETAGRDAIDHARRSIRSVMIPACAGCNKIRNDDGDWQDVAAYFTENFDAKFTHGICPDCARKLYPGQAERISELESR